jgi:hypothetical protein
VIRKTTFELEFICSWLNKKSNKIANKFKKKSEILYNKHEKATHQKYPRKDIFNGLPNKTKCSVV